MNTVSSPWTAPVSSSRLCTAWPSLTQPGTIPSSTSWHNVWSLLSLTQCLLQRLAQLGPMPSPTSGPACPNAFSNVWPKLSHPGTTSDPYSAWPNACSNVWPKLNHSGTTSGSAWPNACSNIWPKLSHPGTTSGSAWPNAFSNVWPKLSHPGTTSGSAWPNAFSNVWPKLGHPGTTSGPASNVQRLAQPPTSGPNSVIQAQRLLQRLTFTHLSWHNAFSNVRPSLSHPGTTPSKTSGLHRIILAQPAFSASLAVAAARHSDSEEENKGLPPSLSGLRPQRRHLACLPLPFFHLRTMSTMQSMASASPSPVMAQTGRSWHCWLMDSSCTDSSLPTSSGVSELGRSCLLARMRVGRQPGLFWPFTSRSSSMRASSSFSRSAESTT